MVEDVVDHRVPVVRRGLRILEHLQHIMLIHGDGVGPRQPGVQIALGHHPALGVGSLGKPHPTYRVPEAAGGGRDELVARRVRVSRSAVSHQMSPGRF